MELIHTNLYSSKDFTQINFKSYVYSLIRNIQNTFTNSENIVFSVTSNDIKLDIEQAIACGQIINELITNSFKHVFSFEEEGKISIELFEEKNLHVLIFSDSGKKTKDFYENSKKSDSLGITIVQELTKYQLKGTLEIHYENGVKYKIYFQKN
jgi:two-component sensor histidine kinase